MISVMFQITLYYYVILPYFIIWGFIEWGHSLNSFQSVQKKKNSPELERRQEKFFPLVCGCPVLVLMRLFFHAQEYVQKRRMLDLPYGYLNDIILFLSDIIQDHSMSISVIFVYQWNIFSSGSDAYATVFRMVLGSFLSREANGKGPISHPSPTSPYLNLRYKYIYLFIVHPPTRMQATWR